MILLLNQLFKKLERFLFNLKKFIGPLVLGKLQPPRDLAVFEVRSKGQNIEVLINTNLKADFEGKYWAGILDAQGKATGDYY